MNSQKSEGKESIQVQLYSGSPKKQLGKEKTYWRKFIEFLLPWAARKWELGERFLEAKVNKEEAEAMNYEAQALNNFAESILKLQKAKANEIARSAQEIEKEKLNEINLDNCEPAEQHKLINNKIKEIEEKMRLLKLLKGTNIEFILPKIEKDDELGEKSNNKGG